MKIKVLKPRELTREHLAAWDELQRAAPELDSPFFRPEFTQAVAGQRGDVEVAVVEEGSRPVAFLPFQRGGLGIARPVGFPLNDMQGWIAQAGVQLDPRALLRGCRLRSLRFDHWLASQAAWQPFACVTCESPFIDLSAGFEAYLQARADQGSQTVRKILRQKRKSDRELGPVRMEHHCASPAAFASLVSWKTQQCQRTGVACALAVPWIRGFMEELLQREDVSLRAELSALYIGEQLAAVHLGLRSFGVLHWWFPAYDVQLSDHSPGNVLIVEVAAHAEALGIRRIDLGKGPEAYKRNLMSGATLVSEGSVDTLPGSRWMWRQWLAAKDRIRNSRWRGPAHRVNRLLSQTRVWLGANQ